MDPGMCQVRMEEIGAEEIILVVSNPLFETIPLLKKKKNARKISQAGPDNPFIQARNETIT